MVHICPISITKLGISYLLIAETDTDLQIPPSRLAISTYSTLSADDVDKKNAT
jgi:hypothetical protein